MERKKTTVSKNWDKSRLVYLYEHNLFTVSEVARFVEKTREQAYQEGVIKMKELYGEPRCVNLHHNKKDQHKYDEPCPVEDRIKSM